MTEKPAETPPAPPADEGAAWRHPLEPAPPKVEPAKEAEKPPEKEPEKEPAKPKR